jgi:nucleotide-binding universal stress UspA family protein
VPAFDSGVKEGDMINRILVPLDGSKLAEGVLPYVEDIARRLDAKVALVQVVEANLPHEMQEALSSAALSEAEQDTERHVKAARSYLSGIAAAWKDRGIEASVDVAVTSKLLLQVAEPGWEAGMEPGVASSTPASKIIEVAHSLKADMIAMSTHGRSGLGRLFFGSVADEVLRESGIPVLLVRTARKPKKEVEEA